ncbi:hypothetical protein VST7929_01480 [Vibrio stylophorae]|uniref:Uncharacterized protein n=1 Tax=Vibrio stylophorae TaxID=659351 RepID=A0ABM8ZTH5_9VIBR|nr:hypothetical protein [Vibrio stylophorae]CAH0533610.1 hypothetical protein VST7929_01480 [Vibrio stylophorae]
MQHSDKQHVRELLIATRYGVSAAEMPLIIGVEQDDALQIIHGLIAESENIHSLGEKENPAELVLYSIGEIDPRVKKYP